METTEEIYIIVGKAIAMSEAQFPEGEKHAVVIHVKADSHDNAVSEAVEHLAHMGWHDFEAKRIGIIGPDSVRDEAYRDAMENGFSVAIYKDIEKE